MSFHKHTKTVPRSNWKSYRLWLGNFLDDETSPTSKSIGHRKSDTNHCDGQ